MRIITRKRLREFAMQHPRAAKALASWHDLVATARWRSLADARRTYPHADGVRVASGRIATVFNICGNEFRLITAIHYDTQRVYVMRFLTRADYDRTSWKEAL
jgi:mRNA interferase HigB